MVRGGRIHRSNPVELTARRQLLRPRREQRRRERHPLHPGVGRHQRVLTPDLSRWSLDEFILTEGRTALSDRAEWPQLCLGSGLTLGEAGFREERTMTEKIVVGVDGSETARLATRWAAREAGLRGATLELVSAWEIPINTYGSSFAMISDDFVKGLIKGAEEELAEALQEVRAEAGQIEAD